MKPSPLSIPQKCCVHLEMMDLFPFHVKALSSGQATCLGHNVHPEAPRDQQCCGRRLPPGLHKSVGPPFTPTSEALQPSVCMQVWMGLGNRLWALFSIAG